MSPLSPQTKAMMLVKAVCEAGAKTEAINILQTGGAEHGGDSTINWPAVILQLEGLVASLSADARRLLISSFEAAEGPVSVNNFS